MIDSQIGIRYGASSGSLSSGGPSSGVSSRAGSPAVAPSGATTAASPVVNQGLSYATYVTVPDTLVAAQESRQSLNTRRDDPVQTPVPQPPAPQTPDLQGSRRAALAYSGTDTGANTGAITGVYSGSTVAQQNLNIAV